MIKNLNFFTYLGLRYGKTTAYYYGYVGITKIANNTCWEIDALDEYVWFGSFKGNTYFSVNRAFREAQKIAQEKFPEPLT